MYDSSNLTKRNRDKTIANSFLSRIQNASNPTTGSAPLLGITDQSIINAVNTGHMTEYRKNEGGCTTVNVGCPCPPPLQTSPVITLDNYMYLVGTFYTNPLVIYDSNGQIFPNSVNVVGGISTYLIKYNTNGIPQWAARIGCTTADTELPVVSADTDGSIYITGDLSGTSLELYNVDSVTPDITLTPLSTDTHIWVAKYNSQGQVQWATYISVSDALKYRPSVSFDYSHNVYITGDYHGTLTIYQVGDVSTPVKIIDPTPTTHYDNYLIKYDPSGQYQWATKIGGALDDFTTTISSDINNNIFIAGFYKSNPLYIYSQNDLGTAAFTLGNEGGNDNYLVKYNSSGIAQWATHIGGFNDENRANIAMDSQGNVYIAGFYYSNPLNIYSQNNQVTPAFTIANSGSSDMYLVKYNTNGIAQWGTHVGGSGSEIQPYISIDNQGNIVVTGASNGSSIGIYDKDNDVVPKTTITFNVANINVFLVKYNSSGFSQWGTYMGDTKKDPVTAFNPRPAITSDGYGNCYLTGWFYNTVMYFYDAALNPILSLSNLNTYYNTFVVKYNGSGTPQWVAQNVQADVPNISAPYKPGF